MKKMRRCDYFGNQWIGMFIRSNDELTLFPLDALEKIEENTKFLKTEPVKLTIGESNLLGVYIAMNNKGAVLPNVATKDEVNKIKKLGLNVYKSKSRHNAHGNNMAVNDKGGIINEDVAAAERKKMEDVLGVELVPSCIGEFVTVGSACIATNKGFLVHYKATDDNIKSLKKIFKVDGDRGTVNTGVGFVSYGVVANSKGYIAGEKTTAFEMGRVMEALGFIE